MLLLALACSENELHGLGDVKGGTDTELAQGPDIRVDPLSLDFGLNALEDGATGTQVVTVTNVGGAILGLRDIFIGGGPFDLTWGSREALEPSESLDVLVTYTPTQAQVQTGELLVQSDDPDSGTVEVALQGEGAAPRLVLQPSFHDFGTLDPEQSEQVQVAILNEGNAPLSVTDVQYSASSGELQLGSLSPLPWTLGPGEFSTVAVHYTPVDDSPDEGFVTVTGNDPDTPTETASQAGNGTSPETTWYIFDDAVHYETTSNSSYVVNTHGDPDLYWYEPSGAHGLIDSADPATDFETLRSYVISGSGGPTQVTGPLSWNSNSTLSTFAFATYTYVLCDFWVPGGDDPALYTLTTGSVDDGIQVMTNAEITGRITLGQSGSWNLGSVVVPGQVNSIVVILVDDSASNRYLQDLVLARDGVIVN